ncbi:MAG: diacylglycerol kinase family protein [Candidatus Microgenomates bacterium]|jgi:diacylglycerol kinase
MSKSHSVIHSFPYAMSGIKDTLKKEPNFKIQLILGVLAIFLGIILSISTTEWLILMMSIFLVLVLELINTTLENLVDIVSPQIQEKARVAKDVAAGGVLMCSILSVIIGLIIFLPKVILLISR